MGTDSYVGTAPRKAVLPLGPDELEIRLRGLVGAYEKARARMRANQSGTTASCAANPSETQSLQDAIESLMPAHPVWPWISNFVGVHHVLTARLLVRLDVLASPGPSSFARICGLETVPGAEYACAHCGWRTTVLSGESPPARHRVRGTREPCAGELKSAVSGSGRVAVRVESPAGSGVVFDPHARMLVHKVARALIYTGTRYKAYADAVSSELRSSRADWVEQRVTATAFRKVQNLYLRHLWCVWKSALGYRISTRHWTGTFDSPWSMV